MPITKLTALTTLDLHSNQLTTLPPKFGQHTALTELSLHSNQLTTLPEEFGQLTALTELSLHSNQLTTLPAEFGQLTALRRLFLHSNPALNLPDSILGPNPDEVSGQKPDARPGDILHFYFTRRRAEAGGTLRPLNEIKVMLVGDGGAGKTSLRRFFMGQGHSIKEPETLGIALDQFRENGWCPARSTRVSPTRFVSRTGKTLTGFGCAIRSFRCPRE